MRSYDPYWNVRATSYPNLLVQTGLSDLLVNYWEPTKLVAKLRAVRTNTDGTVIETPRARAKSVADAKILLHVVDAGHEGYTGDDGFRDAAFQYAFVISRLLAAPAPPTTSATTATTTTTAATTRTDLRPCPVPLLTLLHRRKRAAEASASDSCARVAPWSDTAVRRRRVVRSLNRAYTIIT